MAKNTKTFRDLPRTLLQSKIMKARERLLLYHRIIPGVSAQL